MSEAAETERVEPRGVRLSLLCVGSLLVAAFFGLSETSNGIDIRFVAPWDASVRGELYFWLGATFFLLPGATLIGASLARPMRGTLERVRMRLAVADARERAVMLFALAAIAWAFARICNQAVLLGQPVTDDEGGNRFGGQVLALGRLWVPLPPLRVAFPDLFLLQQGGHWTSFDFPGALLPWTFSEWTRSSTLVFSLFACLTPACVAWACARRDGIAQGLLAGALLLFSPMASTLSMTSHTHVVSRGLLALGFGIILFVERASVARSAGAGLAFGLAMITRPVESALLLLPLLLWFAYDAYRAPEQRARLLGLMLGMLPPLLLMLAYDHALTGSFAFPRMAPNEIPSRNGMIMRPPFTPERLWPRFGNNLSYNLLTLSIWFLGPLGLLLSWLGARASRVHALLGVGLLLDLCLTLLHDDRGLHLVGPIHLSEMCVPLALLAVPGMQRAWAAFDKLGLERSVVALAFCGYLMLGLGTFTSWHAAALHKQALASLTMEVLVEDVPKLPAVVLAGDYGVLRMKFAPEGKTGAFVYEWRRARPDLADPVLVLHDSEQARAEVQRTFPDRTIYVFDPASYGIKPVPLQQLEANAPFGRP